MLTFGLFPKLGRILHFSFDAVLCESSLPVCRSVDRGRLIPSSLRLLGRYEALNRPYVSTFLVKPDNTLAGRSTGPAADLGRGGPLPTKWTAAQRKDERLTSGAPRLPRGGMRGTIHQPQLQNGQGGGRLQGDPEVGRQVPRCRRVGHGPERCFRRV